MTPKTKLILKILLYLLIVAVSGYVGFFAIIIALFGGANFYACVIAIAVVFCLTLILLHMFKLAKVKKLKVAWVAFLSLLFLSCATHEIQLAIDKKVPRIREHDVDLHNYTPFAEGTKAVSLGEESFLKLESDLPVLDGATALYPLYAAFAQAVYPEADYYDLYTGDVRCNNTVQSYWDLVEGRADIIFVGAPSQYQLDYAEKEGVFFRYTPIGREAFVFFVNSENPVESITIEQLKSIYSGKITNWRKVGGKNWSIRPFQRNENSGSQSAFLRFMEGEQIMDPPEEGVIGDMGGIISQTANYANYKNAIGFSFRFYANEMVGDKGIKILKIDSVYPDPEAIDNGTYPLSSSFYAISLESNNKPNVLKLLEWIQSEQGQYLVKETGYSPLTDAKPSEKPCLHEFFRGAKEEKPVGLK